MSPVQTAPPGAEAAPPSVLPVALVAVALLHVAAFAWFTPGNDWSRDLAAAAAIADGGAWPLRGPVVNGAVHLGPVWTWLLALPRALGAGLAATTVFVGVLAMLKVPLAWSLGRRFGGPWLGLAFAAMLLLPGWAQLHSLQLTHTVMLETMLLAAALPLSTLWRDGPASRWAASGALAGLALHAHPVAIALVVPAAAVAWRRRARWRGDAAWLVAGVVLAVLPFAPMLFAEARDGWPVLAAMRAAADAPVPDSRTTPMQLAIAQVVGPWQVLHAWLPAPAAWIAGAGMALAAGLAVAGLPSLARSPSLRRVAAVAVAGLLVALGVLLAVRYRTPFYMNLLAWPPLMLLLAAPVAAWAMRGRAGRGVASVAIGAALAAGAAGTLGLMATTQAGFAQMPLPAIHDVRRTDAPGVGAALMPMFAFDGLAAARCTRGTLRVHGELAALVDFYHGLPFRHACPDMRLELMGGDGDGVRHWAGTSPHTLRRLGHAGAGWRDAWALAPRRVIAPTASIAPVSGLRYPHREIAATPAQPRRFAFAGAADEAVSVYSPLFAFDAATLPQARCDGTPVAPVRSGNAGALFVPPRAGAGCAWEITLESRVPDQVDVVTLPLGAGASR